MPLISHFYGILIYIYKELGGHYNEAHIHAQLSQTVVSIPKLQFFYFFHLFECLCIPNVHFTNISRILI